MHNKNEVGNCVRPNLLQQVEMDVEVIVKEGAVAGVALASAIFRKCKERRQIAIISFI
jgi:hypothetical protein